MRPSLGALSQIIGSKRASRAQLLEYQNRQLRRLIEHAYVHVPYYRRLFDRVGLRPGDIRSVDDLCRVPITSKTDIQSAPVEDLLARGVNNRHLIVRMSGGSTGEPKAIRRTWFEERLLNAFRYRARMNMGLRPHDCMASVGMVRDRQAFDRPIVSSLLERLGLFRMVKLDCRWPVEQVLKRLEEIRPDAITGYPSTIARVGQAMLQRGRRSVRPRIIITSAEVQTPLMRQQMAEAFGAQVRNAYGCNEFNMVAWECAKTGHMHTSEDSVIVEVLRGNHRVAPGESGEVVGTALHSFAMPLIRFRLDDVVTRGTDSCACGAPFSTIRCVLGRMIDYFPLPDGRLLHPFEILDTVLHDRADWARQYQLVQQQRDSITLHVVPAAVPSEGRLAQIHDHARQLLGPGITFRIDFVPRLDVERNGKFRVARSLVRSDYDGFDWERTENAR